MTRLHFTGGSIVASDGVHAQGTITVDGDRITALDFDAAPNSADDTIDLAGGWLTPGFIDTQCNGGGGVLFNEEPTVGGVAAIAEAHRRFGATALLPTIISDTPEVIAAALDAVDAAIEAGVPGVVGVHIEGPVISTARKGIHDPSRFSRLDENLIALLTRPRRGKVVVTLAPERVQPADIARLAQAGVRVSAGHSDADYETTKAAFAAGMTGVTHLYNAMTPLHHRAPGLVGAALDNQQVWCGIIADGHHVHDAALRIALRSRPMDRFMLVSDAMPCVGAETKDFMLQGRPITVRDGRCVSADGTLAGSDLDMAGAVRGIVARTGVTVPQAVAMASTSPAAFLGLSEERGALAPGLRADWVWLTADLQPTGVWVGGQRLH